jgi:glycosyltransferase involved in cell wall biosynthesis
MKIGLISPPLLLTPPDGYGGLERVVYDLGCALAKQGHDVSLMAPPGSKIDGGTLIETIPAAGTVNVNWVLKEQEAYNVYKKRLIEFDIIHDHSWFGFAYLAKIDPELKDNPAYKNIKICHTHHGHLDWNPNRVPKEIGKINLIGISEFMQKEYIAQGWSAKYVYNGIDTSTYPPGEPTRENRLVFVGRISKIKMPHVAIKIAQETDTPLDIIGGTFIDDPQYLEAIKAECAKSNGLISLHLDAPHETKVELVRKASACLVPSKFGEPYGLIATEALSCGTPVIAYDDGALKEIVNNKSVGTICKDYDSMLAAVKNIKNANYSYDACIKRADYFSRENMAERYVKLYETIIKSNGKGKGKGKGKSVGKEW